MPFPSHSALVHTEKTQGMVQEMFPWKDTSYHEYILRTCIYLFGQNACEVHKEHVLDVATLQ